MFDYLFDDAANWKPIYIQIVDGHRKVRTIEDVKLPEEWEVDKNERFQTSRRGFDSYTGCKSEDYKFIGLKCIG
jgi:hypothetical protein